MLDQSDLALSDINKSLLLNPKNSRSYGLRCNILFRSGNKAAALEDCSKAINIDPNNADYYSIRGLIRLNMGDPKGAITDYDQAIIIKPNDYSLYQNRGSIKVMNQDYLGSSNDLKQALKLAPSTANTSGIYSTLCLATQNLGDLNKAIENATRRLKLTNQIAIHTLIEEISIFQKNYEKALKDYNQSIKAQNKTLLQTILQAHLQCLAAIMKLQDLLNAYQQGLRPFWKLQESSICMGCCQRLSKCCD